MNVKIKFPKIQINWKALALTFLSAIFVALFILATASASNINTNQQVIELPRGQKLESVEWPNGTALWVLTRGFEPGETPRKYILQKVDKIGSREPEFMIIQETN